MYILKTNTQSYCALVKLSYTYIVSCILTCLLLLALFNRA